MAVQRFWSYRPISATAGELALVAVTDSGDDIARRLRDEVMSQLVYEDDLGLWEPYWELRAWMGRADGERVETDEATVEQILSDLLAEGLIFLYRKPWEEQGTGSQPTSLTTSEASVEIDSAWWREFPLGSADVWISSTARS